MKVLFRPQRYTLYEAMDEMKEFPSLDEMLNYLVSKHTHDGVSAFNKNEIYISDYGYDERIGWQTYIIAVERYFDKDYLEEYHCPQAIGFCTFKE